MFKDKFFTLDNNFVRFILVGILNTIIGYGLFVLFIYLGLHYSLAVLLSTILGVLFNYKSIGSLVFSSKTKSLHRFVAVYLFIYCLNVSGLWIILTYTGIENIYLSGAILLAPMAVVSFVLNKKFVFI